MKYYTHRLEFLRRHCKNISSKKPQRFGFSKTCGKFILRGSSNFCYFFYILASAMVNYFTNCVAQLRERSVYVQFSNHKALKTDQTHSNASASAQAALQAAQALTGTENGGNGGSMGQVALGKSNS